MKRTATAVLCALFLVSLLSLSAVPFFAAGESGSAASGSRAKTPAADTPVIFEDTFSDEEIDSFQWTLRNAVGLQDGQLRLGGGDWISDGYAANAILEDDYVENYVLDFDVTTSSKGMCYYGFGIRAPGGCSSEFNNGGRFGIPTANEISTGISFDLFVNGKDGIGVALNNGGANGECAQFLVPAPEGFAGSGHVTLIDAIDTITLIIDGSEVVTLLLNDGSVTAYDPAGGVLFEGEADYPEYGTFGFYQRTAVFTVDNVVVREFIDVNAPTKAPATPTAEPTPVPATEVPEATGASAATDAPAATGAAATDAANTTGKPAGTSGGPNTGLIIGIVAGVVAVAAIVAGIVISKKKKK